MDLDGAVTELYGLHPDEFMSAREALARQAKQDGDPGLAKAVSSVRKPTAAAWALNQLVRHRGDVVERLLGLAAALQEASGRRDGAALRDLGRQRTSLVDEVLQAVREVTAEAGGALSGPVVEQVRATVVAALASPSAADAVVSGQLTRSLSYAGFGDVDLSDATVSPPAARRPVLRVVSGEKGTRPSGGDAGRSDSGEGGETDETEIIEEPAGPDPALVERLEQARARTRVTTAEAAEAGARLTEATEALAALDARIADLEAGLKSARTDRDDLVGAKAEATAADKVAQRTLRASFAELDAAQALLPDE